MVAVDTNVLIRLLTLNDSGQADAAQKLFAIEEIWIAKTVLLETDWVLRSLYGFEAQTVREALARVLGLSNVRAEDQSAVVRALALSEYELEFADALHCSSTPKGASFISFNRAFVKKAKRSGADVKALGAKL